ncbi:MAG: VOC family protein [Chitinophagaceae bacterium]|nr:VOC family protein [Chitinophagaceae bacterium]
MSTLNSYLTFNGNCREAMTFYKNCLGGKLIFQTVGKSPMAAKMPEKMKNCILHAELRNENMVLMASDMVGETGLLKGNSVSLLLNCLSEKNLKECYHKLSKGGVKTHPLEDTFWNAIFGGLTDKFGNHWLLNYNKISKPQNN